MHGMYGPILTEAPKGFVPYHQWPEYSLASDVPTFLAPRKVGIDPVGMYRRLWPIVVEEYISDDEPVLADSDPERISANRVVIWQRLFRTDNPPGWKPFSLKSRQLEGFALLDRTDYFASWSESARRYRRKWHGNYLHKTHSIEQISLEEFMAAYTKSPIKKSIRDLYRGIVERKIKNGAPIELWGVRHIESGEITAGMATVNSPTCRGSYYLCGFMTDKDTAAPLMLGLMDHWYQRGLQKGTHFLHFGQFWQPGEPKEWKGFSLFKAKFGLHYISYPSALMRFMRGRLF